MGERYYIFNVKIKDKKHKEITIVFNPFIEFDFDLLQKDLTQHFTDYHQTSAIIFIHCATKRWSKKGFLANGNKDKIFKSIPRVEEASLVDNLYFVAYNETKYIIDNKDTFLKNNINEIVNQGLASIFIKNGGLIRNEGTSHHYVFPSGKHSANFLRTGNILIRKSEIDFIAINTLHKFKDKGFTNIYCDTLSINVLGYSISEYQNRYGNKQDINISSFKSYEGLYKDENNFDDNSIFLISASTSGGIINYIKEKQPTIDSNNICILFYLPLKKNSKLSLERVLCNLKYNKQLNYGIPAFYQSVKNKECDLCEKKSIPIKIAGDSFSLEEPIVNTRNINAKKYITQNLKDFVENFKYNDPEPSALKVNYNENGREDKYSLFIDYEKIIDYIKGGEGETALYQKHREKINAFINQYVPASLKYIIHLNDNGSKALSEYIKEKITSVSTSNNINIINQSDLKESTIEDTEEGAILIVGSCITNGKNLLYLSRFFRNYDKLRLVYFIGVNRIENPKKSKELKTNLKYGLYGPSNSTFVEIENLNCDNLNKDNSWELEIEWLKKIRENLNTPSPFIDNRLSTIQGFSNQKQKGGEREIFYPNIKKKELEIRKNSAFFNNNDYYKNISQSDVFFMVSCVLNNMRNNKKDGLYQTKYVRNLISPFIFNRFNDGIIQASILRASKDNELNYSISEDVSKEMLILLKTFIEHKDEYQGEAIFEFLFALAIGKLRLTKGHYKILIKRLEKLESETIKLFLDSIKEVYKNSL